MSGETLCFQCGLPAGEMRLNHLPNGKVCPTCRDRLLDSLPAPFPTPVSRDAEEAEPRTEDASEEQEPVTLRALPGEQASDDAAPESRDASVDHDENDEYGGYTPSA